MKKLRRKAMIALMVIFVAVVLLFGVWVLMSPGTIRTYEGEKSLSEKFLMDVNGVTNGFFINSVNTDNPVLLFVSSGPGTDDYVFTDRYKDMNLEEDYTVVYWDYRGMGIAYDKNLPREEITLSNILADAYEVTKYLKERFLQEKIYIMGFSGGTKIALKAVEAHPEDYIALIQMAQCVTDNYENDTFMYHFMKEVFTKRDDQESLKQLENAVEHLEDDYVQCKDWYDYVYLLHAAGGGTIRNKSEFEGIALPIILCKCYTVKEKLSYIPAMKWYRTTPLYEELDHFDYRKEYPKIPVPVYFISGAYDYNCPWELVQEYCEMVKAPDKEFFLIPEAAHSPLWENAKVTCEILGQIKERTMKQ